MSRVLPGDATVELAFVSKMRRRCQLYVGGGVLLCAIAIALFVGSDHASHLVGAIVVLLGICSIVGGLSWRLLMRGASRTLACRPQEMLLDRWFTPGPKVGAWKTRLRGPDGTVAMLGNWQLASRQRYRADGVPVRVYGELTPGAVIVISNGIYILVGPVERA